MISDSFDYFWNQCFVATAKNILQLYPDDVRKKYSWTCDLSNETKKRIQEHYNIYRDEIHKNFFHEEGEERRIDSHKIGACFVAAIIDVLPMEFARLSGIPLLIKMSNYALAYYTGVSIVWFFRQAKYRLNNTEYYQVLKKQKYVQYPATADGHDSYSLGKIKAFALRDSYRKDFDVFLCSDMLFWIDHYNRQIIENTIVV